MPLDPRAMPTTRRPYVICHMVPSVDGKIVTAGWPTLPTLYAEYDRTAETFRADAWMAGRVSMAGYATKARLRRRATRERIPRTDYVGDANARSFGIALDQSGKLMWRASHVDGDHLITILSEGVSDDYLAFLRAKGMSYLFGGRRSIDLAGVLTKLRATFGIERLVLEGGGAINGSFLRAGLIDELSVLVAPVADGGVGTPTMFDAQVGKGLARPLALRSVKRLKRGIVWLRYRV